MWFNSLWVKYGGYCIYGIIAFILLIFGAIMWFVHYLQGFNNLPNPPLVTPLITSPIDLAAVTATLGGLVLVGAFYKGKDERATAKEKELTRDLKLIGKLLLLSSACFIIAFFGTEYVRSTDTTLNLVQSFYMYATAAAVAIAGFCVSVAISILVIIVKFI